MRNKYDVGFKGWALTPEGAYKIEIIELKYIKTQSDIFLTYTIILHKHPRINVPTTINEENIFKSLDDLLNSVKEKAEARL